MDLAWICFMILKGRPLFVPSPVDSLFPKCDGKFSLKFDALSDYILAGNDDIIFLYR